MKRPPPPSSGARRLIRPGDGQAEAEAWAWAQRHRGRPAIAPPPAVSRALAKVLKPLAVHHGPGVSELAEHWAEIVGAPLAAHSRPEKMQAGAGGLTLVVRARGPAAALVEAQSARILERVARYAGRAPKRLRIVQGPLAGLAPAAPRQSQRPAAPSGLDTEAQSLDRIMAEFQRAVEEREGVRIGPAPAPRPKGDE
ncbi:DUF721 domain-containing protein [Alkalicaulis satelles]|uniref:DUF721 domain-containing protein n=1 Tax=Alkalicaulis satelles TaxID=2609175 RepID=A0A5M6ZSF1_9PROT|nr:DUF721 domain-containing protein [Alkalicaulis satelles]KAA5805241.1 DUF721 domain-containing protein [Alkalicaulis satelles]